MKQMPTDTSEENENLKLQDSELIPRTFEMPPGIVCHTQVFNPQLLIQFLQSSQNIKEIIDSQPRAADFSGGQSQMSSYGTPSSITNFGDKKSLYKPKEIGFGRHVPPRTTALVH